jgi:GTP-binding protein HflX
MNGNNNSVQVSGLTGAGLDNLLDRIDAAMPVDPVLHLHFELPLKDGRAIALVHALGRVLHSEVQDSEMAIEAEIPESVARQLRIDPAPTLA